MKLVPGAVAVLVLLALLTWLVLRGTDTNAPAYAGVLRALDEFALAEASLHRDVLQARAGVLRNYDTLVEAAQAMQDAVLRIRAYAQTQGLDPEPVDHLAAATTQQEELAERFKTDNALLQNSLSYVGLLSTGPPFGADDAQLAPVAAKLAAGILHLTRDTSSEAVRALQERIGEFAARAPAAGPEAEAARSLLAHARLLQLILPAVDDLLRAFVAVPTKQSVEQARILFARHQRAVEEVARRFRLLLYLVSILLLTVLVYLGMRLRGRALALRRRAAFEHVIAENSTRLINIPLEKVDGPLEYVLGEFCRAMGAERAYVVLDEKPLRVHACSVGAAAYPPGWPEQALALSARLGIGGPDIIAVQDVAALPPSSVKNTLAAAGVRSWACVPLVRAGGVRGIMGFDAFRPALHRDLPLPVVRLAGDAVANAIEREFLERDRARLAARLERARRLQMIGSLASGIAHNFNNLIGAILGYSEMVQPQLAPGSKAVQHINEIRRAAERGRDLIESILGFGRPRGGHLRSVQVRGLFDEAAALLRATLPSAIELIIEDTPVDLAVSGEPAQLQQVMLNLCTNAAQAIEGSGHIRVSAQQKDAADFVQLSHGELPPGRYVCLAVADNGHGFDETVARRLFEPFFTTRATGTGLGLATVHEVVRDHEGAMNVQSHPGHGSRFEAWLPAAAADGIAMVPSAALSLGRGQTVLVINSERERLLRDEEMLAALGYEPVGFERADDAIAACRSGPDRFDIIIVGDASQPKAGLELARMLHEIAPEHPLLLATASEIDGNLSALAQAGISEVLRRPVASTELASALARCLRSSGALRP